MRYLLVLVSIFISISAFASNLQQSTRSDNPNDYDVLKNGQAVAVMRLKPKGYQQRYEIQSTVSQHLRGMICCEVRGSKSCTSFSLSANEYDQGVVGDYAGGYHGGACDPYNVSIQW